MIKNNIWSILIIGLLFALLFSPLIVSSSLYFPYITGKLFTFRFVVSIGAILWLILVLKKPEFLPKKNSIIVASGLFVLWLAIANFFGIDPSNSFFSNFERMEGWFTHLYLFVYLVILSSVFQTEKLWNQFLNVSVVVANIVSLSAAFDQTSRTQIYLGNSTYVAIYILFNLFFASLLTYRLYNKKTREDALKIAGIIYYISSIILFVYVIFRTQTRGTVLALVFSIVFFLILSALSYWKNKKVRIVSVLLLILMVAGSVLFWVNRDAKFIQSNPLLVRIATISASEGTGKARLVNWGIALKGIKERPVLGWGQENYSYVFSQKYDPRMYGQEPWFDRTHNSFLDWSIQGGIPSLLIYLSIFIFAVWNIMKSSSLKRTEKNILVSLLIAYIIHNMFVFDNYSSYLMFFTVLGFIIHHSQKERTILNWNEKTKQLSVIIGCAVFVIFSIYTIFKPLYVAAELVKTLSEEDPKKVLSMYQNMLSKNTAGTSEAGIRLINISPMFFKIEDEAIKKEYFDTVVRYGDSVFKKSPDDVRLLEMFGNFLMQTGNVPQSIEVLEKARVLAPDRQNNLYALGFAYINNKEYEKAKEVLKHAYEILPENEKAKNYYGAILLLTGDKSGKDLIGNYSYKDPFFLNVFVKTKQYKEVIKIREQLKLDNPTDYQNQISLAVAYFLDGQKTKAIQIIRDVQKVVPEFKEQGDALIKDILAGKQIVK